MKTITDKTDELLSIADKLPDMFFIERQTGKIINYYFNPDSNCGGTIVENILYSEDIIRFAEQTKNPEEFFEMFESECKQYNYDITDDDFGPLVKWLADKKTSEDIKSSCEFLCCDTAESTMRSLIDFATARK